MNEDNVIRVTAFGGLEIRDASGKPIGSLMQQPRRAALFIYLLIESANSRTISRDRILGIFWPDLAPDRASHALSQALTYIRRSAGDGILAGKGSGGLGIIEGTVSCDVLEFAADLRRGSKGDAVTRYAGDLLDGFVLDDAIDFEHWLEAERATLRRSCCRAAGELADECERRGAHIDAAAWARRAVELSYGDETETRRLITLLDRIGDRTGALSAYAALKRRLKDDFDAEPAPETAALMERITKPVISVAQTEPVVEVAASIRVPQTPLPPERSSSAPVEQTIPTGWFRRERLVRYVSAAASIVVSISFLALWGLKSSSPDEGEALPPIVVIEDVVAADPAEAGFAITLTNKLMEHMKTGGGVRARAASLSSMTPWQRPRDGYVVRVHIEGVGPSAIAHALLLQATNGNIVQTSDVAAPSTPDSVAQVLAVTIRHAIGKHIDRTHLESHVSNRRALRQLRDAFQEYDRADSLLNHYSLAGADLRFATADSLLDEVIAKYPLSDLWMEKARVEDARSWTRILRPVHNMQEARYFMDMVIASTSRAIEITPTNSRALEMRGFTRHFKAASTPPESADAIPLLLKNAEKDLRASIAVNSRSPRSWSTLSNVMQERGRFQEAYWAAERAYSADVYKEHAAEILMRLFDTAVEVGDTASADKWCGEIVNVFGHTYESGYCVLSGLAWRPDSAPDELNTIRTQMGYAENNPRGTMHLGLIAAVIHARRGDTGRATELVDRILADPAYDDQFQPLAAWAKLLLHDQAAAGRLLDDFEAKYPMIAPGVLKSRRFATLHR
jgi:serine/threonine-protein kinase